MSAKKAEFERESRKKERNEKEMKEMKQMLENRQFDIKQKQAQVRKPIREWVLMIR